MPARTVTHSPTTQNRTEIVVRGEERSPKGWVQFERTLYAQDKVQAMKAPGLYPLARAVTVQVVRNIGKRSTARA